MVMRRLRKLALAFLACLVFAVLAPMYFAERRPDEGFAISPVIASPRDMHVLAVPVRLSDAPDLTLTRGVVYDYGPATSKEAASRILLDNPVFTLNAAGLRAGSRHGDSDGADLGPLSAVIQQIVSLSFHQITIHRGTLHVTMADGTVETIGDIQAELKWRRKGQIGALGNFTVRGQRVAFDASISQPLDKKPPQRWALQASFKASLLQGTFDGHEHLAEDLQLSGEADVSTPSLRRLGKWFGLPLHITEGFNATTIKGELTWARRSLTFEKAKIVVDGNEANGRLALNTGGERPHVEAVLDFSVLDLTPHVEAARTQLFGLDLAAASWSWFDISLPMIRYLDGDLRISARKVMLKGYTFGPGGATITARAGRLQAVIPELDLNSGTLSAQVTAIMSEVMPRYALRAELKNFDAGPASTLLLGAASLTGRATLTVDLTSTGYSPPEIIKRLSGKAELTLPEGGRLALDLKALAGVAKSGARGWAQLAKSQTAVERLEARALIIDGVAFLEKMQAHSGSVALAGSGRFGLHDGNMDIRLTLKSNSPADQAPKVGSDTVTLRGPWHEPAVRAEDTDTNLPPW